MIHKRSKLGVILLLAFVAISLSGCSLEGLDADVSRIFEEVASDLSNFWNDIGEIIPDMGSLLEGILSGLSGIGESIRDMFSNFSIF